MEKETLSKGVCQQLTDAFVACGESFKGFFEAMENCNKQFVASALHLALANILIYEAKIASASFLTRWLWRRKLKKAKKHYNQLVKFNFDAL